MESKTHTYANITQRAVSSFLKSLTEFKFMPVEEEAGASEQSQRDLHAFFSALYARIYAEPTLFGLPVGPDSAITQNEANEKDKKQEVKRLLDRPRGMISAALDFLMLAGQLGRLDGAALILDGVGAMVKQTKIGKKFLAGLESAGLHLTLNKDQGILANTEFPAMMPALQAMARHCAAYESDRVGKFMFAGCDFRALRGYQPEAKDLYHVFKGEDFERAATLHAYFSSRNYKTEIGIGGTNAWVVKYQGDRKIKGSPLFQIDYEDRYARPQRLQIKCASTGRIADLLPKQSQRLQEDFQQRIFECRGDECGWCRNKTTLGPSVVEYHGEYRTACWYSNSDIRVFDENTIDLIEEYEQMHTLLAPEK